jgi:hypothetical protein
MEVEMSDDKTGPKVGNAIGNPLQSSTFDNIDHFPTQNKNGYCHSDFENIFTTCLSRGVCKKTHEPDLADLIAKLGYSEDVYIADLCSSIDRKMWWNESTPLMIACLEGGSILVKVLLLLGADVSATNELNSTGRQQLSE